MAKMSARIAEEAQLLADEKWIIDTLTKIKHQRNCLQIERLHLESLRASLNQPRSSGDSLRKWVESQAQVVASTSTVKPINNKSAVKITECRRSSRNSLRFEVPAISESSCNEEPLDLAVTKSVFSQEYTSDMNTEEYDDDEDTCDNIVIDINMLMNSNQPS